MIYPNRRQIETALVELLRSVSQSHVWVERVEALRDEMRAAFEADKAELRVPKPGTLLVVWPSYHDGDELVRLPVVRTSATSVWLGHKNNPRRFLLKTGREVGGRAHIDHADYMAFQAEQRKR